jgi:hypothetical protein
MDKKPRTINEAAEAETGVPSLRDPGDGAGVERAKANWAELARLPGIGEILFDARQWIDANGKVDAIAVFEQTALRMAKAETVDDILAEDAVMGAEDYLDRPFTLMDVRWADSDIAEGMPVYLIMDVVDHASQRPGIVTTGAADIVAKCHALWKRNKLPVDVEIRQSDKTNSGFYALKLVKAGAFRKR